MSTRKSRPIAKMGNELVKPPVTQPATDARAIDPAANLSPPWSVATKSIVAVVWLLLITLIIWRFQELIRPLVVAAILAYLLNPPITGLMRIAHINRGLAVVIVYLVMLLQLL